MYILNYYKHYNIIIPFLIIFIVFAENVSFKMLASKEFLAKKKNR